MMATASSQAVGAYRSQAIMTASKGQLITMAYDGLRKYTKLAIAAIEAKDVQAAHNHLIRSQEIVKELYISLDLQQGGEIASNLQRLYDYMYTQLVKANLQKDSALLEDVLTVLQPIRDGWVEAVKLAERQGGR